MPFLWPKTSEVTLPRHPLLTAPKPYLQTTYPQSSLSHLISAVRRGSQRSVLIPFFSTVIKVTYQLLILTSGKMQILCIWPHKMESWGLGIGSSHMGFCCKSKCRNGICDLDDVWFHSRRANRSWVNLESSQFGLESRVFLFDPKRVHFRAPCALVVDNQFVKDDPISLNMKNDIGDNELEIERRGKGGNVDNGIVKEDKNDKVDVRALARSLRIVKTSDDVEEILKDKNELPLQVYSTIIRAFGKEKRIDCAVALVEWLKEKKKQNDISMGPNLFIYNSLLGAVKQCEKYDEVDRVVNDMGEQGVEPNIVTLNTLMSIYIEQGRETEALCLFEEIQKKGLSPSPASYSIALLAFRRLEDGLGTIKFYTGLKEKFENGTIGKDSSVDWENEISKLENFTLRICYQVMRRWLVKSENLSTNVLKLLTEMDRVGLEIGRDEYERLVWACTREEHYIVVKELYNRIRERYSDISLSVCNHVIWLMGKAKKWWAALEIYEDLLDKGPKPNNMSCELVISHFNILLSAARKRGIWRWGIELLNKMEEKGLNPSSKEWNSVLIACSKASETSAAVEIFKRMVEKGEKPTIISYGALLSALEKGELYDEALRVWQHMINVGIEPNLYAYTIMASIYTAQGKFDILESIIQDMVSSGIEPTVVTFNAIISACANTKMGNLAYEWFGKMKAQNILPNEVTYEMLIEALASDGKPKLAYDIYLRARNEGLNLSSKAYDTVIRSSQDYGATIDFSTLGQRPPNKHKRVPIR